MLFSSPVYSQASGSIAGLTYSHNKGGMYTRARATPTDPASSRQMNIRASLAVLSQRWGEVLTASQRDGWAVYAANVPIVGPLGTPRQISGFNHYIRSNQPRHLVGLDVVDAAPTIFDLGQSGSFSAVISAATGAAVTFNTASEWHEVNGGAILQFGLPQSPSINYFRGPWRLVSLIAGAATSPATRTNPFSAAVGQRQWLRIQTSTPDARLSYPITLGPITLGV